MLECVLRHKLGGKSVRLICMLTGIICGRSGGGCGIYAAVYASAPPTGAVFGLFMAVSAVAGTAGSRMFILPAGWPVRAKE